MGASQTSYRYAKALFNLGSDAAYLDQTTEKLEKVQALFHEERIARFLKSPVMPIDVKREVVRHVTDEKDGHSDFQKFIDLLLNENRFALMPHIIQKYRELVMEKKNLIEAVVHSPIELAPEQKEDLRRGLAKTFNKNINLAERKDPTLIGGLKIEIGNELIDLSVKNQISKFCKEFAQK